MKHSICIMFYKLFQYLSNCFKLHLESKTNSVQVDDKSGQFNIQEIFYSIELAFSPLKGFFVHVFWVLKSRL